MNSRSLIQPSELDALAEDLRLVVFGQLVSRYGIDKLKDQLKDGMLNAAWIQDLRGLNAETVKEGLTHLHELSDPNWPPSSASFRKICLNHLKGFPDIDESMQAAMLSNWCNDGIIYAITLKAGGTFWIERATEAAIAPRWKRAYYAIREEWLNGMRYHVPPSTLAITQKLEPERTNSPFIRLPNEPIQATMKRYFELAKNYRGELPNTEEMLMRLIKDNYLESRMLNDWRMVDPHKRGAFTDSVKQFYVAAYFATVKAESKG